MNWLNIIYIIISIVAALVSVFVTLLAFRKSWKDRKKADAAVEEAKAEAEAAKTEAEKAAAEKALAEAEAAREKANRDLLEHAKNFIADAEAAYEGFDKVMRAQNSTAAGMKKETVFTKLQAYALQNGYEFNATEWSDKIDKLVEFTKTVNTTKKPY